MDRLSDLSSTLSNLTMYDIKSMYNQAKNVVLNVSEMEAKVREATNDDPWGASSTLMTEIAQGTFNFQNFNEIMPCIYSQFMEKEAKQWRQIYKSLQLLEYLVKHGSERVVDDARSHISTLKMLRNFHHIDDKGKDQGVNVRNRSRELVDLLSDVEKIRAERRKAKANRSKYVGTGNDGFSFSGGGRYGGFGNDSMGSSSFGSYGSGGGGYGANASGYDREYGSGGGGVSGGFRDDAGRKGYEEYDAGDYESPRRSASGSRHSATTSRPTPTRSSSHPTPASKAPEPVKEVDLLGFGDDDDQPLSVVSSGLATDKALPALSPASPADVADDEFADFVAAPTPAAPPATAPAKPNLMDLINSSTPAARPQPPPQQSSFGSFSMMTPTTTQSPVQKPPMYAASPPPARMSSTPLFAQAALTPTSPPPRTSMGSPATISSSSPSTTTTAKKAGGFDDLWTMSLGASGNKSATGAPAGANKSIKDLEKEKAQAGIWGGGARGGMGHPRSASMAFGSFGQTSAGAGQSQSQTASGGGADDLLL